MPTSDAAGSSVRSSDHPAVLGVRLPNQAVVNRRSDSISLFICGGTDKLVCPPPTRGRGVPARCASRNSGT